MQSATVWFVLIVRPKNDLIALNVSQEVGGTACTCPGHVTADVTILVH